ncbi:MAG: 2-C-methyl-D-erythritol 4-phosphate cytidylyltransferase [Chlamydiales bacterium]|jgi:2-C-methyl-D-erythritol 4-phosphate cytidylyltransferase
MSVAVILLAGGKGLRMASSTPKQYLPLKGKTVSEHSYDLFLTMEEVQEIVVVCATDRRKVFDRAGGQKRVTFAQPGERRQDSVFNGLQKISEGIDYICIHDSARPCLNEELVRDVISAGKEYGAAALGLPVKYTVKETEASGLVKRTLKRENIWEVQTPQVLSLELLKKGFLKALLENLTVTDDVSLAELLGSAVKLVKGSSKNIKITTPDDLVVVESLLECER